METWEIGEKVFISEPYDRISIGTVLRKTKTMVIVQIRKAEIRFRETGSQAGGDMWRRYYMQKLTPKNKDNVIVQNLQYKARELKNSLAIPQTKEEIEKFIKAIEPFMKVKQ